MTLSVLESVQQRCVETLAKLKRETFLDHVKLTLVARVPGVEGSHIVISADDLDEVAELLKEQSK